MLGYLKPSTGPNLPARKGILALRHTTPPDSSVDRGSGAVRSRGWGLRPELSRRSRGRRLRAGCSPAAARLVWVWPRGVVRLLHRCPADQCPPAGHTPGRRQAATPGRLRRAPRQLLPLLFLTPTRTPRRRYDDQLGSGAAQGCELVGAAQVVASGEADGGVAIPERDQIIAWGNRVGLAGAEGVVEMDLPVRRLNPGTRDQQGVVDPAVVGPLQQAGDDHHAEVRGTLRRPVANGPSSGSATEPRSVPKRAGVAREGRPTRPPSAAARRTASVAVARLETGSGPAVSCAAAVPRPHAELSSKPPRLYAFRPYVVTAPRPGEWSGCWPGPRSRNLVGYRARFRAWPFRQV